MLKSERYDAIVDLVNKQGTVEVNDIAEKLNVSDMTIRRDLKELADQERLMRVHGGARSLNHKSTLTISRELTHSEKSSVHASEKMRVAELAAELIEENQTIFLGPGTTVADLAGLIPDINLRVITNSLPVIEILSPKLNVEVCALGGTLRHSTGAFVGPIAEESISALGIDIAFIGANGVNDAGISTSTASEGCLQMKVLDRACTRCVLVDSSKINKRDFYTFYKLDDLDYLITDSKIDPEQKDMIEGFTTVMC